ncbi:MAG: Dihydroorotate dehydrogenase (quinone), mitochondrial [Stictis urceolatum]|nr:Dihydroorotate dehydrogenase (quinone), mitochondrial [Stictis urceolata]
MSQRKAFHSLRALPIQANTGPNTVSYTRFPLSRRYASTATVTASSAATRTKNFAIGTALSAGLILCYYYVTDTRASFHQWAVVPALRLLYPDAEDAHLAGNNALRGLYAFGLHPRERRNPDAAGDLGIEVFGHKLENPIGTSAGIDKNGEIPDQLLALGPSIIEVGGTTPWPQDGNPKPRVFRLPSQNALINRYGLNSEGAEAVAMRLQHRVRRFAYAMGFGLGEEGEKTVLNGGAGVPPGSLTKSRLMAVQVAKNKFTPDDDIEAVKSDYVFCVNALAKYADIVVVNVSSPNTPGLRDLQKTGPLTNILKGVVEAAAAVDRSSRPAVMVKVSPDEDSDEQVEGICNSIWASGVDGVIVGNTTKRRPEPMPTLPPLTARESNILQEQGGFSGPHLFDRTVSLVRKYRKVLDQRLDEWPQSDSASNTTVEAPGTDTMVGGQTDLVPRLTGPADSSKPKVIFATGGITNGKQALEVLNAGASLAMIYTALVYGSVGTISRIKQEMRDEIARPKVSS